MKKITLLAIIILSSINTFSQIIFAENFETTTNLSASGWSFYNDNHTLNNGYDSIFTNAWEIVDWAEETPNKAASTSSAFNEIGPADRWLVSPSITIPDNATNIILTFKARSFDIFPHQDGFKLKISSTSNSKTSFTTTLLSIPNTPNILLGQVSNTTVDLSAYAGQTIYLAWIDDFENGNILAIDDIELSSSILSVTDYSTNHFLVSPNPNNGTFKINSSEAISEIKIYDVLGNLVYLCKSNIGNEIKVATPISKGIYILQVGLENKTATNQKIVIE
jgi:Secretion system C-terminal sorting domain